MDIIREENVKTKRWHLPWKGMSANQVPWVKEIHQHCPLILMPSRIAAARILTNQLDGRAHFTVDRFDTIRFRFTGVIWHRSRKGDCRQDKAGQHHRQGELHFVQLRSSVTFWLHTFEHRHEVLHIKAKLPTRLSPTAHRSPGSRKLISSTLPCHHNL